MRILYLAHRLPYPPNKGERIRSFHHLRHLTAAHEVHLVSVAHAGEAEAAGALRAMCRSVELVPLPLGAALTRVAAALAFGGSLSAAYFGAAALRRAIRRAAARASFDVAWASTSALAPLLSLAQAQRQVVDFVDVDSVKWREFADHAVPPRRWMYAIEASRLAALESRALGVADCVLVSSAVEARVLRHSDAQSPVRVVENGVDAEYFRPAPDGIADRAPHLVFTGSLDYRPNVDAVLFLLHDVLPLLRQRLPQVRFTAVGHQPARALRRAAQRAGEGVALAGSVPDVRPYLAAAQLCVVPLRFGRGVKNKVLEAMAMGVPVVASPVAVEGLSVRDGVHLLIASSAAELAGAAAALLNDPARRRTLALAARQYVLEQHRWEETLRGLDECLEAVGEARGAGRGTREAGLG